MSACSNKQTNRSSSLGNIALSSSELDLTVRNATIVTAAQSTRGDIGVRDGRIAIIADSLPPAAHDIDATGKYVLPGGIDSHCHVEQLSASGLMTADDFYSATVSAAFGGTTCIIPFAAQHRGMSLPKVVEDYHACAGPKAVIDYGFHLIVSDPTPQALSQDLPNLIKAGYTSFKVYMTIRQAETRRRPAARRAGSGRPRRRAGDGARREQ